MHNRGVDDTGPHIYAIRDGHSQLADAVGFVAIGTGARQAELQLMQARYDRGFTITEALALVHLAKSRAEVAPGVGTDTDMFLIGPSPGTYGPVTWPVMNYLRDQVERMRVDERNALFAASQGMRQFLDSMARPQEAQEADPDVPEITDDSGEIAGDDAKPAA